MTAPAWTSEPLAITKVEPIGQRRWVDILGNDHYAPEYPDPGTGRRHRFRMLQRDVIASLLGITVAQLDGIESGSMACDWAEAERRLREYAARKKEDGHE